MKLHGKITSDKKGSKNKPLQDLWNKASGCKTYYTDTGFGSIRSLLKHVKKAHMWMDVGKTSKSLYCKEVETAYDNHFEDLRKKRIAKGLAGPSR